MGIASIETKYCVICNKEHPTDNALLSKTTKANLEPSTCTEFALCSEHLKKAADTQGIFLVEILEDEDESLTGRSMLVASDYVRIFMQISPEQLKEPVVLVASWIFQQWVESVTKKRTLH